MLPRLSSHSARSDHPLFVVPENGPCRRASTPVFFLFFFCQPFLGSQSGVSDCVSLPAAGVFPFWQQCVDRFFPYLFLPLLSVLSAFALLFLFFLSQPELFLSPG